MVEELSPMIRHNMGALTLFYSSPEEGSEIVARPAGVLPCRRARPLVDFRTRLLTRALDITLKLPYKPGWRASDTD